MRNFTTKLLTILLINLFLFSPCCSQPATPPASPPNDAATPSSDLPKAVIIDQLCVLQPNQAFLNQLTLELEDYSFEVDLYQGDEITVDLYRNLPDLDYKLIIFRAHSGLLSGQGEVVNKTSLFTNEPYSETKHIKEQLSDQLAKARIDKNHPYVFSIRDKFITQSMKGEFNNTVIIMMGCSCLHIEDLARAFIDQGASAYLAWDATVDLGYVDKATPYLMEQLCANNLTVKKAVSNTMNTIGPDPLYGARLKYFPPQSGDKTLKELLNLQGAAS